jgi:DnaK suppressor protein
VTGGGPRREVADDRVAAERARTVHRIAGLERDLQRLFDATADSPDDEHDPEGATIGFERAQVTALLAAAHTQLAEIDALTERLASGAVGTCERCGQPIGAERLDARPATTVCVACAR